MDITLTNDDFKRRSPPVPVEVIKLERELRRLEWQAIQTCAPQDIRNYQIFKAYVDAKRKP